MLELAKLIIKDGEGASKFIESDPTGSKLHIGAPTNAARGKINSFELKNI